jgi:hypothetical protein
MKKTKHQVAMEIVQTLIESGLSFNDKLQLIENVRERLKFCKQTGAEMQQLKLF